MLLVMKLFIVLFRQYGDAFVCLLEEANVVGTNVAFMENCPSCHVQISLLPKQSLLSHF